METYSPCIAGCRTFRPAGHPQTFPLPESKTCMGHSPLMVNILLPATLYSKPGDIAGKYSYQHTVTSLLNIFSTG